MLKTVFVSTHLGTDTVCINQTADKDTIFEMLDFYRECMGV